MDDNINLLTEEIYYFTRFDDDEYSHKNYIDKDLDKNKILKYDITNRYYEDKDDVQVQLRTDGKNIYMLLLNASIHHRHLSTTYVEFTIYKFDINLKYISQNTISSSLTEEQFRAYFDAGYDNFINNALDIIIAYYIERHQRFPDDSTITNGLAIAQSIKNMEYSNKMYFEINDLFSNASSKAYRFGNSKVWLGNYAFGTVTSSHSGFNPSGHGGGSSWSSYDVYHYIYNKNNRIVGYLKDYGHQCIKPFIVIDNNFYCFSASIINGPVTDVEYKYIEISLRKYSFNPIIKNR